MTAPQTLIVMRSDVVPSSQPPDATRDVAAAEALDRQVAAVQQAGGRLVRSEGGGVVATFGSATAAVAAAQAIQQQVPGEGPSGAPGGLAVTVGISAGDTLEGDAAPEAAPVLEAARLSAMADAGQILAAQVVWLLTSPENRRHWNQVGERPPKGLSNPVMAYEVPWRQDRARPLGVVVADDSALLRSGIARLLDGHGMRVVGEASDGDELAALVEALHPDLVIVDIRMPPTFTIEGIRAAEAIRAAHPQIGILVLSQHVESRAALGLLRQHDHGIGYLLKDRIADIDDFLEAVDHVARGGTAIDPEIVALLLGKPRRGDISSILTAREHDVLAAMAEGRSNRAIGDRLGLGARTVESHIASIFTKLGLEPEDDDHRRVLAVLTYLKQP